MATDRRHLLAGLAGAPLAAFATAARGQDSGESGCGALLFAELHSAVIPNNVGRILTVGRDRPGRFGAAYGLDESQTELSSNGRRVFDAATAAGKPAGAVLQTIKALEARIRTRSADGRYWILDEERPVAGHFGAAGDGSADDSTAIQALLDWHTEFLPALTSPAEVHIGAGTFRIGRQLQVGYRPYSSIRVLGAGKAFGREASGTKIVCDFSAAGAAFAFSSVMQGGLSNMSIIGQLARYIERNRFGNFTSPPALDDRDSADWSDPQLPWTSHRRFSPYAAVAVDPFAGARPNEGDGQPGYADIEAPAYVPQIDGYGRDAGSSKLTFVNLLVEGFNTAFAVQPADFDANGDFMSWQDCTVARCIVGWSVGNSQSRNLSLRRCEADNVHTVLTTSLHGRRNGRLGGHIEDLAVGDTIDILNLGNSSAVFGPVTFTNLYCESTYRLGHILGGTGAETSLTFRGCKFGFHQIDPAQRGVPRYILGNPSRGELTRELFVVFEGCTFDHFGTALTLLGQGVVLRDTRIRGVLADDPPAELWRRFAHNATAGGLVTARFGLRGREHLIHYAGLDLDGGTEHRELIARRGADDVTRRQGASHYTVSLSPREGAREDIPNPQLVLEIDKSALPTSSFAGVVWRFSIAMDAARADAGGLHPGGVLLDQRTGLVFWISERQSQGTTYSVQAVLQNGFRRRKDGGHEYEVSFSAEDGVVYCVGGRHYTPAEPLFVDTEAGEARLQASAVDLVGPLDWPAGAAVSDGPLPAAPIVEVDGELLLLGEPAERSERVRIDLLRRATPR